MLKQLKIGHINIRSLTSHFSDFKHIVLQNEYHILGVSETWINNSIVDNIVQIDGYKFVHTDRVGRGGGVGLYVKDNIKFTVINLTNTIEQQWLKFSLNKTTFVVGVVYRPPSMSCVNFLEVFESSVSTVIPLADKVFCVGDFNINLLHYESSEVKSACEVFESLGLVQVIDVPTRITPSSSTLIDFILTTDKEMVITSGAESGALVSDHEFVYCITNVLYTYRVPLYKTCRDFKYLNHKQFENDLRSIPWNNIYDLQDIDSKVNFINENIMCLLDLHAPFRTYRITKPYAPWLTATIRAMISDRKRLLKKYKKFRHVSDWNCYKQMRNIITAAVRVEKKKFFSSLNVNNQKEMWSTLKLLNLRNNKPNILPEHLSNVENINKHFITSIPTLPVDKSLIECYKDMGSKKCISDFNFSPVNEIDILKIISNIKSKATGTDGINICTLNLCLPFLLPYLTHIINACLSRSVFPLQWKKARIIPLSKVASPTEFCNLRPISILPTLSKILEKVMEIQLTNHLRSRKILPIGQSGFRAGYSCATAMLKITDDILSALDRKKLTALVLLDYSKAFDTLNHEILINILSSVGLSENVCNLISSYLNQRVQAVTYSGNTSTFLNVTKGIPQGSVLGPLLFSTYISGFPSVFFSCEQHYYADDTQIYLSFGLDEGSQAVTAINYDLQRLYEYSVRHCLGLNSKKSSCIIFGRKAERDQFLATYQNAIVIDDEPIKFQDTCKNLGIVLDQDLRFTNHVTKCLQKAYLNLKLIYQNRHFLDKSIKTKLCESLVLSHVNYCDVVYGPCLRSFDIGRIQRLQNSCLRLIHGIRKYDHISHTLKTSNWLDMHDRRFLHSATLFFSILKLKTPPYLFEKITYRTDIHNINIRFKGTLTPPLHSTHLFKRSFSYQIASVFNKLPLEIKQSQDKISFKRKLFKMLFSKHL